ncbi:MAG: NYN domain-containing protein [Smithellaceae bacterium]|nr:NYN domain-containing protein [Smithellaceae bacterium]
MHIIVDGYNLIRQSPSLRSRERISLETGRNSLISLLSELKKIRPHRITVVFDGREGLSRRETREAIVGIQVIYSAVGETADDVIKRMATEEAGNLLVVTSDREIGHFIHRRGGATILSPEFEQQLSGIISGTAPAQGESGEDEPCPAETGTKKKGPSRRPSRKEKRLRQSLNKP